METVIIEVPVLTMWCFALWMALEALNVLAKIAIKIIDWKLDKLKLANNKE